MEASTVSSTPTQYEIRALRKEDVSEAAAFSIRFRQGTVHDAAQAATSERKVNWLLFDNPFVRADLEVGQCLRSADGRFAGVSLQYPAPFRYGDGRLVGLCAAGMFIETTARMQGFLIFRRFLKTAGVDFHFATTCNANSAALWQKLGKAAVPGSGHEYLVALRYGPILAEWMQRRPRLRGFSALGRIGGAFVFPSARRWARTRAYATKPTDDWEQLSELAERCRRPEQLTLDRSVSYVRWRFERGPGAGETCIYRYGVSGGAEGWFALRYSTRGLHSKIRACTLIDLVRPARGFDEKRLVAAVIATAKAETDLIVVDGPQLGESCGIARRHAFGAPRAFFSGASPGGEAWSDVVELTPVAGDRFD